MGNTQRRSPMGWLGIAWGLVCLVALVWAMHWTADWLIAKAEASARGDMLMPLVLAGLLLAYALLIALPFVPGIEIGLSLLALRGADVAPFVYLATVAGLMLAYAAGYLLPHAWLARGLRRLRLRRTGDLLDEAGALPRRDRLDLLHARMPRAAARLAVRWRYVLLALLYNMPGSGLIGGGGGISLIAGLSRVFLPAPTLATVAVAVAPVPLLFWSFGVPGFAT